MPDHRSQLGPEFSVQYCHLSFVIHIRIAWSNYVAHSLAFALATTDVKLVNMSSGMLRSIPQTIDELRLEARVDPISPGGKGPIPSSFSTLDTLMLAA